jgi:hypothetical protein
MLLDMLTPCLSANYVQEETAAASSVYRGPTVSTAGVCRSRGQLCIHNIGVPVAAVYGLHALGCPCILAAWCAPNSVAVARPCISMTRVEVCSSRSE